ncbi:MAG: Gfo/Idh/MocA family oxidoreductase, partial [Planctomycetaceae bacterium]|nr:Gfo/Idh/MocA family oxidoreductase [Planctomycetaceae bacterium]
MLVRTRVCSTGESGPTARGSWNNLLGLVGERLDQIAVTLVHDGPRALWEKASHMLRREGMDLSRQFVSFVGEVIDDRTENPLAPGTQVVGFSFTHPPAEQVLARREHLWVVPPETDDRLAALLLFGGQGVAAIQRARSLSGGPVAVVGEGILADLLRRLLAHSGVEVGPADMRSEVWIAVPSAELTVSSEPVKQVIGCGLTEAELVQLFPAAEQRDDFSLRSWLGSEELHVDLFYQDGPCEYPEWFRLEHCEEYLAAVPKLDPLPKSDSASQKILRIREFPVTGLPVTSLTGSIPNASTSPKGAGKIGVSLIGGGRWGLGAIVRYMERHPAVQLRGVCDRRPEVAWLASQALPFGYTTTNIEEICADSATDVVVVASYHGIHAPQATAVLNAGKHCFVEKPIAINERQLEDLAAAAKGSGRILYVGYNRRFAPLNEPLMQHIGAQTGPLAMNFFFRSIDIPPNNWYYWPSNGNRVISNICHAIDYSIFLASPALPVRISTMMTDAQRLDENVVVDILFEDNSIANILFTSRGTGGLNGFQRYHVARGEITAEFDFHNLKVIQGRRCIARWKGVEDVGHRAQVEA